MSRRHIPPRHHHRDATRQSRRDIARGWNARHEPRLRAATQLRRTVRHAIIAVERSRIMTPMRRTRCAAYGFRHCRHCFIDDNFRDEMPMRLDTITRRPFFHHRAASAFIFY